MVLVTARCYTDHDPFNKIECMLRKRQSAVEGSQFWETKFLLHVGPRFARTRLNPMWNYALQHYYRWNRPASTVVLDNLSPTSVAILAQPVHDQKIELSIWSPCTLRKQMYIDEEIGFISVISICGLLETPRNRVSVTSESCFCLTESSIIVEQGKMTPASLNLH